MPGRLILASPAVPSDTRPLLIFPAGYGDGPERRAQAASLGQTVVGASSVADDPAAASYELWGQLPHVSDPGFDAALAGLVAAHGIGRIHASHYAAWHHLKDVLPSLAPGVELTLGRNIFDVQAQYRALAEQVAKAPPIPQLTQASQPSAPPRPLQAMAWLRAAMSIPGESYEPKLLALIEAGARAPAGDIVEIGCLFGRTAALLAMLANGYDLGPVICVDPWSIRSTEQGNAQLKAASEGFDWDAFRRIFEVNVTPFAGGRLNYIHALSTDGYKTYAAGTEIETEAFGRTRYSRRIGLLHIDGNHEYEHVLADANDWIPHVQPGGWIVFDDYEWDWGDGPQRVADAWIADNTPRVRTHFVAGGAMFIQLA